jgi:hypothetical protein
MPGMRGIELPTSVIAPPTSVNVEDSGTWPRTGVTARPKGVTAKPTGVNRRPTFVTVELNAVIEGRPD